MKFQKDNSNVALTQQMKDEVAAKERKEKEEKEEEIRQHQKIQEKEVTFADQLGQVRFREYLYGPIGMQLDMLWHDMDEGRIYADTTSENTWYSHIKKIKDNAYLSPNWTQELANTYNDLTTMVAKNNSQDV
jgi:hypothetical protein